MIEAQVLGEDQDPSLDRYLHEWLAHARGRVRVTTYTGYEYLNVLRAVLHRDRDPARARHGLDD